jgi:predicted transcriptional regulator of viral defense system
MQQPSYTERVINLASQKGLLRPSDLDEFEIPRIYLTRLTASGALLKVGRGLYKLPDNMLSENESLAMVAIKIPQAVICLLSALQFHELTTQLPRQVWIALPRGSNSSKISYPPIKLILYSGESYTEGIEIHQCEQVPIKVYCIAKTIADCFKHRNKIGLDVALEALRDARSKKKATTEELWRYAKICRVSNVMRPYLEATE